MTFNPMISCQTQDIANKVRRRAADITEDPFTSSWLRSDERGTWEAKISSFVDEHQATFDEHEEQAVAEAATYFSLMALTALLRNKRRK